MIEASVEDGIAVLTLRHGSVNALDLALLTRLPEVLAEVADARAVVLTGSGRCLSAGVDLKRVADGGAAYVEAFLPALSTACLALFDHPRPVVAAVNGHALAGGCVLTAACDLRLMSGGTIGLTELAAGVPFPTVPLELMRHAVGPALDAMVLTGAAMDASAARAVGLVHEVVGADVLLATAVRRADELSTAPAEVYALAKRQLHRPAHERIEIGTARDEAEVLAVWTSDRTLSRVRDHLASLRRR